MSPADLPTPSCSLPVPRLAGHLSHLLHSLVINHQLATLPSRYLRLVPTLFVLRQIDRCRLRSACKSSVPDLLHHLLALDV